MRIKTIIIVIIAILLTIILMQNTESVIFKFLWASFWTSKLLMLFIVALIGFVLGVLVGRPKKIRKLSGEYLDTDPTKSKPGTLSEDDKNYIG